MPHSHEPQSPPTDEPIRPSPALTSAMLRITASLDVKTVLREVVTSALALTGARLGVITTVDDTGRPLDVVTSGLSADEERQLKSWDGGERLFQHFVDQPEPLRLDDLPGYVRSLGLSADLMPARTMQGMPMRHRGSLVGIFFLAEKKGALAFTDEDEDVLLLFARLAAAVIANARVHRDEQRARADLEALVETSPVGVVVFDAASGRPVSVNREAIRMIEVLRSPGCSHEDLLEFVTFRRADGREIALDEFPLTAGLKSGETIRAEEIVLSVPDGRSVATLVNATPIPGIDGDSIESVVVTLQDLEPLNALERQRSKILSLVSHELRAPLAAIKGSAATVLSASEDLDRAELREFFRIVDEQADQMRGLISDVLDVGRIETGTVSINAEPTVLATLVDRARTTFLSADARHPVNIDLPSDLPRVMVDRQRIAQVLNNLLANAARHSPESTPIHIAATSDGAYVTLSIIDEGSGISAELLPHVFSKHAGVLQGSQGSAAGLGLAICKGLVEAHGGRIFAESDGVGTGTRLTFTVPAAEGVVIAAERPVERPAGPPTGTRVLVVDDDPQTLRYVRGALAGAGYAPLVTGDPRELPRLVRSERPDLVLLDLLLPHTDGIKLMGEVPELADIPVIFISAYGRDETIARALEIGAADYIVKPFSTTELIARVQAALRQRAEPERFALFDLEIRYEERRATLAGEPILLTATEFDLLRALSLNAGRVATYDILLRQVWVGRKHANEQLVRTFVKKLRHKLGDPAGNPSYILNVRGVGYRMPRPGGP